MNLWAVEPFSIQIVANQAVYTSGTGPTNIPAETISMLDVYLSQINGGGAGINIDRIMIPMSRTIYDQFSNKLQPGQPTMYWFEKVIPPTMTLYQPPLQGYPTYAVSGHLLRRLQDVALGDGQTVDVQYQALDALAAGVALRLARKYRRENADIISDLKEEFTEAMTLFTETNREDANITIAPADSWWGMRD